MIRDSLMIVKNLFGGIVHAYWVRACGAGDPCQRLLEG